MKNDEIREVVDTLARFCIYFFVVIGVQLIIVFGFDNKVREVSNFFASVFLVSFCFTSYFYSQAKLIEGILDYIDETERLKTIRQRCVSYTGYLKEEPGLDFRVGIKGYSYFRENDRKKAIKNIPREIKRLDCENLKAEKAFVFWKKLFYRTDIGNFFPINNLKRRMR